MRGTVLEGTAIDLPSSSSLVTGVDFTLSVGWWIFRSGFEPGEGAWSFFRP